MKTLPVVILAVLPIAGCMSRTDYPARCRFCGTFAGAMTDDAGNVAIPGRIIYDVRVIESVFGSDPVEAAASGGVPGIRATQWTDVGGAARRYWLVGESPGAAERSLSRAQRLPAYRLVKNAAGLDEQVPTGFYTDMIPAEGWRLIPWEDGLPAGFRPAPADCLIPDRPGDLTAPLVVGFSRR